MRISSARRRRDQVRAARFRMENRHTRLIKLIDRWGCEQTIEQRGKLNRTQHPKVLTILEKRAQRYKNKQQLSGREGECNLLDETGTLDTSSLLRDGKEEAVEAHKIRLLKESEVLEACGVSSEMLRVHGIAPGTKPEGVVRIIYENLNGIQSRINGNEKLDKAKELINDLEADIVCYNEHRLNLSHKDNKSGFAQMFRGGESDIRAIAAHNKHEYKEAGRVQEGGTAMMVFGPLIEQFDFEASGRDSTGLGRWTMMVFRGENGLTTRVLVAYNPCYNKNRLSRCSYQQHKRYFLLKERDDTCPRERFKTDLLTLLEEWRQAGDRLIICMDANEHIYRKQIGRMLTNPEGLNMKEVVGDFTGKRLGATYFRGSKPTDAVWATNDISVAGACLMPVGFGVGDHRLFVVDVMVTSIIGAAPPKVVRAPARRLNTKLPRVAEKYKKELERLYLEHRMNTRLVQADSQLANNDEFIQQANAIDKESTQYRRRAEKKCRKIKSGKIPYSPEAAVWIRRKQVYESLLRFKLQRIRNRSNLRRAAQRCGIKEPLKLSWAEIKGRLKVCADKCKFFQKHGAAAYRREHLRKRLSVAQSKKNKVAEQQILDIIRREKDRALWRRLNYSMAKKHGRSVRLVQQELEDGTVSESNTQTAVEHSIWSEIHGKRFHIAEQAPICRGRLRGEFGYMANTPAATAILSGQYVYPDDMHQGTKELLVEAFHLRQRIPQNSVSTSITREQWAIKWKKAKETTSSSVSSIHFGHYIAGAQSHVIPHHDALKVSICLKRGVTLERWTKSLTCILEKEPGNCLLTKMRAIPLMEADFNACNKLIYGDRMLLNVRNHGLMADEIFSEAGRTAEDGALAKVLFYDIVRQSRLTAAISSVDASNCYDSIAHAVASIIFQSCGVPKEGVESMLGAIQNMQYYLRTAFGDSRNCRGSKIELKYQGLCQGNGAAPAGWAVISITILNAHKRKGHGAVFRCPISKEPLHLAAILYVDDCDLIHVDMGRDDSAEATFHKIQASVDNWGQLLIASGGGIQASQVLLSSYIVPMECKRSLVL